MPTLEKAPLVIQTPLWAQPQAWFERGHQLEAQDDPRSAAYCYYLALEFGRFRPALERLEQLGYLTIR